MPVVIVWLPCTPAIQEDGGVNTLHSVMGYQMRTNLTGGLWAGMNL